MDDAWYLATWEVESDRVKKSSWYSTHLPPFKKQCYQPFCAFYLRFIGEAIFFGQKCQNSQPTNWQLKIAKVGNTVKKFSSWIEIESERNSFWLRFYSHSLRQFLVSWSRKKNIRPFGKIGPSACQKPKLKKYLVYNQVNNRWWKMPKIEADHFFFVGIWSMRNSIKDCPNRSRQNDCFEILYKRRDLCL